MIDPDGESPISALAKKIAKHRFKAGMKAYAEKNIQNRLKKYMTKELSQQFAKDLNEVLNILNSTWWETLIEVIMPVAGNIYGASKFGVKTAKAWRKLQDLENDYIKKVYDALPADQKKRFKKNMRSNGVNDARKDQGAGIENMGETYEKGKKIDGHHKKHVKDNLDKMTDPENIQFMKKKDHIKLHKETKKSDKA